MKLTALFAPILVIAAGVAVASGCGGVGPAPITAPPPSGALPTPPAKLLYADHLGTLYQYRLPLAPGEKPLRALTEWPNLPVAPAIAVGPYGDAAVASATALRLFHPPIVSFDRRHAYLAIKFTPAITEVGPYGADLVDMQYDPNNNLWLFNNLGGEISELRPPLSKHSVAALTIAFGQPGSKTSGFTMVQARFDVNAALYVYGVNGNGFARLFKLSFPYAKQFSSVGINLEQADFVDSSQYLPTSKNPASVLLGQYYGPLRSPKPGSPPSPPVDVMSQFDEPLNYQNRGLFPNHIVNTVVGALVADPPRQLFYTLGLTDGRLDVYPLPLVSHAKPILSLPCLAGASKCNQKEHLFLAP